MIISADNAQTFLNLKNEKSSLEKQIEATEALIGADGRVHIAFHTNKMLRDGCGRDCKYTHSPHDHNELEPTEDIIRPFIDKLKEKLAEVNSKIEALEAR